LQIGASLVGVPSRSIDRLRGMVLTLITQRVADRPQIRRVAVNLLTYFTRTLIDLLPRAIPRLPDGVLGLVLRSPDNLLRFGLCIGGRAATRVRRGQTRRASLGGHHESFLCWK
jgi:hypothetical protein